MGLNIVKKIIDEINGSIKVKSNREKGTDFTVTFPRFYAGDDDIITKGNQHQPSFVPVIADIVLRKEEYRQGRATILIVEDNREMLYYLQTKLHHYYNIFYASNGKNALMKIKNIPRPDIIISDIMMDEMDGFEFYDKLKTIDHFDSIPFIFLTALTSTTDKINSLYKGAIDYIFKPFNIDELIGKIHSILRLYDALKRENLLTLGERLFYYLKLNHIQKQEFTDNYIGKKERTMKSLYEQYGISERQIQIIALLKVGLLRKEICTRLNVSMNTLKTHMGRLFEKCGVGNKTELLNIFY